MFASKFFHGNGIVLGATPAEPIRKVEKVEEQPKGEVLLVSTPKKKLIRKSSLLSPKFGVHKVLFRTTGTIRYGYEEGEKEVVCD